MFTCPKGCQSSDADYCSLCGAKIANATVPAPAPQKLKAEPAERCPDCGAARVDQARFCELCRYNFVTHESSTPSVSALVENAARVAAAPHWEAEVRSDAPNAAPVSFPLDLAELLIGRRSETRDIRPEIPIEGDAAVSHRHAKLLRQADGSFAVMDLSSSNGTQLNDTELKPGVRTALKDGDRLRIGRHTLIHVHART